MSVPKHVVIGGICLPMDLESMETLPLDAGGVSKFDFVYRGIHVAVRYQEEGEASHAKLVADVGPMPFTAESPAARSGLGQIMVSANDALGACFRLTPAGRILLGGDITVVRPVTATHLFSAVATFLARATPYLDLIAVFVSPPLAGEAEGGALRPEWHRRSVGA
ncbi:hypothetical protein [Magnetospirillum sp. UT-4]|uniref:hypothetical protein n=1 Tax=Magnetospirillum sp. UT-4 TaxID=2681467 RepID=UPI00137C3F47|nr:hypothetical protein [Magnetospirillum sp. UT-4]CAA7612828.1 conserved hypothetical protein [Magnetospirillum sp. UT-4]